MRRTRSSLWDTGLTRASWVRIRTCMCTYPPLPRCPDARSDEQAGGARLQGAGAPRYAMRSIESPQYSACLNAGGAGAPWAGEDGQAARVLTTSSACLLRSCNDGDPCGQFVCVGRVVGRQVGGEEFSPGDEHVMTSHEALTYLTVLLPPPDPPPLSLIPPLHGVRRHPVRTGTSPMSTPLSWTITRRYRTRARTTGSRNCSHKSRRQSSTCPGAAFAQNTLCCRSARQVPCHRRPSRRRGAWTMGCSRCSRMPSSA